MSHPNLINEEHMPSHLASKPPILSYLPLLGDQGEQLPGTGVLIPLTRLRPFQALPPNGANTPTNQEHAVSLAKGDLHKKSRKTAPKSGDATKPTTPIDPQTSKYTPQTTAEKKLGLRMTAIKAMVLPDGATPETSSQTLKFANRQDATLALLNRSIDYSAPKDDETIPSTDEERGRWVLRLLVAMKNRHAILDKKTKANKRWALPEDGKEPKTFYGEDEMERVCWEIVHTAEMLHRYGPQILTIFDHNTYEELNRDSALTFEERMEYIIKMLCFFKAKCDSFMKGTCTEELVAAVRVKFAMALGNRKQNDRRAPLIQYGRNHFARQQAGLDGADDQAREDNEVAEDEAVDDGSADDDNCVQDEADESGLMCKEVAADVALSMSPSAGAHGTKRTAEDLDDNTATLDVGGLQLKRNRVE